jgi:hypothetical protein
VGSAPERWAVAFINVWDNTRTDFLSSTRTTTGLRGAPAGAVILLVSRREREAS